jgi:alcohol dehydrogenase (cytochrome c)
MMWANRNGFFYVLDRVNGKFLWGSPFVKVTWATGLDVNGRPIPATNASPTREGSKVFPGNQGATNWFSPSYSPRTKLFYIPTWSDYFSVFTKGTNTFREGQMFLGGYPRSAIPMLTRGPLQTSTEADGYGTFLAIDPRTGEKKWEFKMKDVTDGGLLTTASDVLFGGGREGIFYAIDARNGKELWRASLGGIVNAVPITYKVGETQFVSIAAGHSVFTFALRGR